MFKLSLAPDQASYTVDEDGTTIATRLKGGASRYRKDILRGPVRVNLQWTCGIEDYIYLTTFYRVMEQGSLPFLMDLLVQDNYLTEHECRVVPKSWATTKVTGISYIVKAVLEVVPRVGDPPFDEGLVTTYESFGTNGSEAYGLLAVIVNDDMRVALK